MKLNLTLQDGSRESRHQLEFTTPRDGVGGSLSYVLDEVKGDADWEQVAPGVYSVLIGGRSYEARVTMQSGDAAGEVIRVVTVGTRQYRVAGHDPRRRRSASPAAASDRPQEIRAPMPGKIVKILVSENQEVAQGTGLLVIEAMKMQNELRAPRAGRVEKIYVAEGTGVEAGSHLVRLV